MNKIPYAETEQHLYTWVDFEFCVMKWKHNLRSGLGDDLKNYVIYPQPRGGYALGLALSHVLGLPIIEELDLRSPQRMKYDKILFVDDVWETGKTFNQFYLKHGGPTRVIIPVVWVWKNQENPPMAVYIGTRISPKTWAVFPWENQDMAAQDRAAYYNAAEVSKYPVNNIYACIQGEGAQVGLPMTLLRLHGCDVGCPWCDTKETWELNPGDSVSTLVEALGQNEKYNWSTPEYIAKYIADFQPRIQWVMLTGGEPATWELKPLIEALHKVGKKVALETSGTRTGFIGAGADWVCVSPKINMPGGKKFLIETLGHADELKMVIGKPADVETLKGLLEQCLNQPMKTNFQVSLQPVSQSEKATQLCIETAQAYNWRVSIQIHKYIGQH